MINYHNLKKINVVRSSIIKIDIKQNELFFCHNFNN